MIHQPTQLFDQLDGLLIAMAPTTSTYEEDRYKAVYGSAIPALVRSIQQRSSAQSLHVTYLSSAGVYGDKGGQAVNELTPPDMSNSTNALLTEARIAGAVAELPSVQASVLRLGGIYGPGKDIPGYIRSASGCQVPMNGNHINAWVHLVDIIRGVDFAFQRRLQGLYNLVDDMQMTRRELSNALCDEEDCLLWSGITTTVRTPSSMRASAMPASGRWDSPTGCIRCSSRYRLCSLSCCDQTSDRSGSDPAWLCW